jgi:hypothetical protein
MKPRSSKLDRIDQPEPKQWAVKSLLGTHSSENFLRVLESKNGGTADGPILPLNPKPADYQDLSGVAGGWRGTEFQIFLTPEAYRSALEFF